MPAKQSRIVSPAVASNAEDRLNLDSDKFEMPPTSASSAEHSYALNTVDDDEIDVVNDVDKLNRLSTNVSCRSRRDSRLFNQRYYHPTTDHDYITFSQFSACIQTDIINRIEDTPNSSHFLSNRRSKAIIARHKQRHLDVAENNNLVYGLNVDNETSVALGWKGSDKRKKYLSKSSISSVANNRNSTDKNFVKIQGSYQDDFVYFAPKISGSRARRRAKSELLQQQALKNATNNPQTQVNVLDWYRDLANTDKSALFGDISGCPTPPSEEEVVEMVVNMQDEQDDLDKMAENLSSMLCSLNNEELEKELQRIGLPTNTTTSTTTTTTTTTTTSDEAPELTTVTMYWNDVPGLMLTGEQYVRLVDIHKQMLPSKDTGILKKRAQLMNLPLVNCSDMQRNFLQRYANAARSKSTLVISRSNAVKLIAFYVEPKHHQNHNCNNNKEQLSLSLSSPSSTTPPPTPTVQTSTDSKKQCLVHDQVSLSTENIERVVKNLDYLRVATHRNQSYTTKSRCLFGKLFLGKLKNRDSLCLQCENCQEFFSVSKFQRHHHSANQLSKTNELLFMSLASTQPSDLEAWNLYNEKMNGFEPVLSKSDQISPRHSIRNRKRKQLHPVESYVFTPTKKARSSQRTA